jgi:presenilin-like A22 family membrane protease
MQRSLLIQLAVIFAITQAIGISIGYAFLEAREMGIIKTTSIVNDNPDDSINAAALFVQILVMAGVLILIIRYLPKHKKWLLKLLEIIATTTAVFLVAGLLLPSTLAILTAVGLLVLRFWMPDDLLLRNAVAVCAASVVGALLGIMLGIVPILLFMIAIAAYDLWAVFGTKHMVEIAENVTPQNLAFTVAMPTPEHRFELGTGDLVVPLAFATSVMSTTMTLGYPAAMFLPAGILVASLAGIMVTLDIVSKKIGRALPALPIQTVFMIVVYFLHVLLAG